MKEKKRKKEKMKRCGERVGDEKAKKKDRNRYERDETEEKMRKRRIKVKLASEKR